MLCALHAFALSFGLCNDPHYEWLLESGIGSTCDQDGNYTAGSNLKMLQPALDTITVIDHANGGMSARASVTVSAGCPVRQLYGDSSEEANMLRKFRDEVACTTPVGKQLISLYYRWSPLILDLMENNGTFRAEVKKSLDTLVLFLKER